MFDIRAAYTGNRFEELSGVDLCKTSQIIFEQPRVIARGQRPEQTPDFTVVNQSRREIRELMISAPERQAWSANLLAAPLAHGKQAGVKTPDNAPCTVDVRVVYEDQSVEEKRRRNVCSVKRQVFSGRDAAGAPPPTAKKDSPKETAPPANTPPDTAPSASFGSGFLVTADGHALTNSHVVVGCARVTAVRDGISLPVTVAAVDHTNDLALLRVPVNPPMPHARFRAPPGIRTGEEVMAAGFPFPQVLKNGLNVTRGNVSAMGGVGGNSANIQMTAPVQPGNSGGPLFDMSGHVVGVVVSRLNSQAVKSETQNINYAIQGAVAKLFLESQGVKVVERASASDIKAGDLSDAAREFTIQIVCHTGR